MSQQTARTMKMKSSELYALRMEFERAAVTDFKGVADSIDRSIDEQFEETGKVPPADQLDMLAGILDYVAENIERVAQEREIINRTAEEWRKLEHEYVVRADFTLPDLIDMLLTEREAGRITREELQATRRKYRPCEHRFCLNYFVPNRKDQKYCDHKCRKAESNAVAEFKRTSKIYANGTYLPVFAYKDIRDKQEKENYEKHERLFEPATLELIGANKELEKYEEDGRRDRTNEERSLKSHRIDAAVKAAEERKPGAVQVKKMMAEEMDQYFREKYSERHLQLERKRAIKFEKTVG
ncbi:hypothetical protein [Bacillus gobiensis]|uniref:Uncharacterized protein n=1 Tax=Bacillus gobiensis TaxID=1441095 RepID=A0A0M4FX16_9BACI|nr:hypothetical protein [Bacillus gobiensis]ALC81550.1 hypothetical protein AM592_08020 [Bacillus gobiensis]